MSRIILHNNKPNRQRDRAAIRFSTDHNSLWVIALGKMWNAEGFHNPHNVLWGSADQKELLPILKSESFSGNLAVPLSPTETDFLIVTAEKSQILRQDAQA